MIDLSTTYLGMKLKNPLVASSSPLSKSVRIVRALEKAGVSAIVMHSLFEEEILNGTVSPESYLQQIEKLKDTVDIPIIASLNGQSRGGWIDYAQKMEAAGADALELNAYYIPTDFDLTHSDINDSCELLVQNIHHHVKIPVAVKLSPWINALPNFIDRLTRAGADAFVLFNRFYQPDINLDNLQIVSTLKLSTSDELRLPLRWIALLYGKIDADLALTTGVHEHTDVLKAIMAGADVTMMASTLLKNGPSKATDILSKLTGWMKKKEYESIQQIRGVMSLQTVEDPTAFVRANYMKILNSYS